MDADGNDQSAVAPLDSLAAAVCKSKSTKNTSIHSHTYTHTHHTERPKCRVVNLVAVVEVEKVENHQEINN